MDVDGAEPAAMLLDDAGAAAPVPLLLLPTELLVVIVTHLNDPISTCRFGLASHATRSVGHAEEVWASLLARLWPDAKPLLQPVHPMRRFVGLAYPDMAPKMSKDREGTLLMHWLPRQATSNVACPWGRCGGTLLHAGRRCICAPTRCIELPLRIASLDAQRSGSSSFTKQPYVPPAGFSQMLTSLSACYALTVETLPKLDDASLAPLDVLVLCTTEGPALDADELAAMRRWVENGGALIVSGFSNWSRYGHFAADTLAWLGLVTIPNAQFGRESKSQLEPHARSPTPQPYTHGASAAGELAPATDDETTALLDFSRFGLDRRAAFSNCGETHFNVTDQAFEAGAVQLVVNEGSSSARSTINLLERRRANLVFFPPDTDPTAESGGATVVGRGRVLVCSNYHWIADPRHWMGGKVGEGANLPLLHNFVVAAVAARAERTGASSSSMALE